MEKENLSPYDLQQVQINRIITLANFLAGIKMNYPLNEEDRFTITKNNSGFELDADNFTFVWVIGLLPLVFGKYWAYSNSEKIILKEFPDWSTFKSIQYFFGLSAEEYFHLFVANFQPDILNHVSHDVLDGKLISENLRTIVKQKLINSHPTYGPEQGFKKNKV